MQSRKKFDDYAPTLKRYRTLASHLFRLSGAMSMFVAVMFREDFVRDHFMWLSQVLGYVIPGIDRIASVAPLPALTATIYALNWLFVPAFFYVYIMYSQFWAAPVVVEFIERGKRIGFKHHVFCSSVFLLIVLSDFGVITGLGFFSMSGYESIIRHFTFAYLHSNAVGIALFYWAFGMIEAFIYAYFIAIIGGLFLHLLRKFHWLPLRS